MPDTSLIPNRRELRALRHKQIPVALAELARSFGDRRYEAALTRFLGEADPEAPWNYSGSLSPNTRSAYTSALAEFFEWLGRERGEVVSPEFVTSVDVERYVQWLLRPTYTLGQEKLRDEDQPVRLAVFETLERLGSSNLDAIFAALPQRTIRLLDKTDPKAALSHELGRMVLHDNLVRSPTMAELRQSVPGAGLSVFRIAKLKRGGFDHPETDEPADIVDMDELFIYRIPLPKPVSRRTVAARLAALSAFWETLREGENIPGSEPVLQHNVIKPVLKRVSRGMAQEIKRISRSQKPDPVAIIKLMRTVDHPRTLAQFRNRALLLLLLFTGMRVEEAVALRRAPPTGVANYAGWFEPTDPPRIRVLRKGGRQQLIPYPPMALEALAAFQTKLETAAAPVDAQSVDPASAHYLSPDSPRWRYAELSRRPDAPLFPALYLWGANSQEHYTRYKPNTTLPAEKPLTRHGVWKFLKALAEKADLMPEQRDRIHPHALRHFAAVAMFKGGKPLLEIQEMLGHESITTTEQYIQELVTEIEQSGQNEVLSYLGQFEVSGEGPTPAPTVRPSSVIETRGERVHAERPEPSAEPVSKRPTSRRRTAPATEPAPEQSPQVEQIVEAVETATELPPAPAPAHSLPVSPVPTEEQVELVLTGGGPAVEQNDQLVAIGGERLEGHVPRLLENRSSGSPDYVYEALSELGSSTAIAELAAATRDFNRAKKARDSAGQQSARARQSKARAMLNETGYDPIEWTTLASRGPKHKSKTILTESGKDKVQKNRWLAEHYDPWLLHYGVGHDSLLVWYAKGQASAAGYVVEGTVVVPPIPVLSPEQVDPQTEWGRRVLECAERTYSRWMDGDPDAGIGPSPTRAFGLVRWYGFLSFITGQLERHVEQTDLKVKWQPWNAVLEVGKHVRAHENDWICSWLKQNAHTYITSIRAFETVSRGRGKDEDVFWRDFTISTFQGRRPTSDLPEWFADDDPVKAIYDASPKQWDQFADWIESVTGQRMSAERRVQREEQRKFVTKEVKVTREVIEGELELYYDAVDIFAAPAGQEIKTAAFGTVLVDQEQRTQAKLTRDTYEKEFQRKYGINLQDPELVKLSRTERIRTLVAEAFPDSARAEAKEGMEQSKNTLGDSKLFDPRYFRLSRADHTIRHTPEFREEFFDSYGQDSELVLRRAARAMWEYARENAKLLEGKLTSSEYSYLYSMMLAYVSWVIPAGDEMEKQIRERSPGSVKPKAARLRWIASQGEAMRALVYAGKAFDISSLEQQPDESLESWSERIAPLLREQLPPDAPERDLINAGNALSIYRYMMMSDAMAAEEEASAELVQRSLVGEIAGEAGTGRVIAPRVGREERKAFSEKAHEHTPNYSGRLDEHELVMTSGHWWRASRYLRNAELVLPNPFSMIRAMNQAPAERRGLLGGLFR